MATMSASLTTCVPEGAVVLLAQYWVYCTELTMALPRPSVYVVLMLKYGELPRFLRKKPTSDPSDDPAPAVPAAGPPAKIGDDAQYTAATFVPVCSTGPPWYTMSL